MDELLLEVALAPSLLGNNRLLKHSVLVRPQNITSRWRLLHLYVSLGHCFPGLLEKTLPRTRHLVG